MKPEQIVSYFKSEHQSGIDRLLDGIQQEFAEIIYGPDSKRMVDVAFLPERKYWVALDGNNVIGSVGVMFLKDSKACLKSMFVQKEYRGATGQIANKLLITALNHAMEQRVEVLYLGTMIQFKTAQSFYLKKGFIPTDEKELPTDFVKNPVDKIFFRLDLPLK